MTEYDDIVSAIAAAKNALDSHDIPVKGRQAWMSENTYLRLMGAPWYVRWYRKYIRPSRRTRVLTRRRLRQLGIDL